VQTGKNNPDVRCCLANNGTKAMGRDQKNDQKTVKMGRKRETAAGSAAELLKNKDRTHRQEGKAKAPEFQAKTQYQKRGRKVEGVPTGGGTKKEKQKPW